MTALAHPASIARKYHRFSAAEKLWLVLSYQRYAALLFVAGAIPVGAAAWLAPTRWWAWLLAAPISLKVWAFAVHVAGRLPGKLRITGVAQRRIDAGRFEPSMVRELCSDPCFRTVAQDILVRSGMPSDERRALLQQFSREVHELSHQTVIIDHRNGKVIQMDGRGAVELTSTSNPNPTNENT